MKHLIAKIKGNYFKLKCKIFKKNISIGCGLKIYKKLYIEGNGRIQIGNNLLVDGIKGDTSQFVTMDTYSDGAQIIIGNDVELYATRISSKYGIKIGDNVRVEESGIVDTDFHSIDTDRGEPLFESIESSQINIMDNVTIGARSLVLKGVTIAKNAVIMPGSVVSLSVKDGLLVGGNPARKFNRKQ